MDFLENAFNAYLEELLAGRQSAEFRLRDLKDSLTPRFISDEYPLSRINSTINKLVLIYRRDRRTLSRIGVGAYLYDPKGNLSDSFHSDELVGYQPYQLPMAARVSYDVSDVLQARPPETVAELASSSDFLVVRNRSSIDIGIFEGLSF